MRVYNRRKAFAKKSPLLQKNCKVGKIEVQERQVMRGNKNTPHGRGGVCPARDITATAIYRVICRHGYYAARCSQTGNATYRANRTERSRPFPTNLPETPYHHGILQQQNSPPRRGGACPARDITATAIYRVICRHGYYAARCSQPGKSTQRANRTERSRPFPTNLPEIGALPITAHLPVICREGS